MFYLKKSKMNEKQIISLYGQRETLETQILALEQSITNTHIISAMKNGQTTMSSITNQHKLEDVEDTMDDISEVIQKTDEMSVAMTIPVGPVYDEDELLKELEDDDKPINSGEKILESIKVPTKQPGRVVTSSENDELNQLKEIMNI